MAKRVLDIAVSAGALVVSLPILALVAMLIKLDSPGPVIYKGVRIGLHGRLFKMHKFRTMVVTAEQVGGPNTPRDDPRITRVGRWIRRFGLPESAAGSADSISTNCLSSGTFWWGT